jgi:hypothetical protein
LLLVALAASTAYEAHGADLGRALKWLTPRRALKVRHGRITSRLWIVDARLRPSAVLCTQRADPNHVCTFYLLTCRVQLR